MRETSISTYVRDRDLKTLASQDGYDGAIANRLFIRIHLYQRIIHPHAGQGGEDILHGVNLHEALRQSRRPLDHLHFIDDCRDRWLICLVHAEEFKFISLWSRLKYETKCFNLSPRLSC